MLTNKLSAYRHHVMKIQLLHEAELCKLIGYYRGIEFSVSDWPVNTSCKLQALVYSILPSTTDVFSYAIGS